jgi:CHRD domain
MMRYTKVFIATVVVVVGVSFALAALSLAATTTSTVWTAALTSGKEVPAQVVKNPNAHGLFKGTLTGSTLHWKLTFAKLTGPAMMAHIHMGAAGKPGGVVVTLFAVPRKSGVTGTATLTTALKAAFKKHLLYVNVHTAKNPNGEIRGQLASG